MGRYKWWRVSALLLLGAVLFQQGIIYKQSQQLVDQGWEITGLLSRIHSIYDVQHRTMQTCAEPRPWKSFGKGEVAPNYQGTEN